MSASANRGPASARRSGWHGPTVLLCCVFALFQLVFAGLASGAENGEGSFEEKRESWSQAIQRAEDALESGFMAADVSEIKRELQSVATAAEKAQAEAETRLSTVRQQLEALGPPPGEGDPPEDQTIARLRKNLQDQVSAVEGRARQANLSQVRANELLEEIAAWEQERFREMILRHNPPPFNPAVWNAGLRDGAGVLAMAVRAPLTWWEERQGATENPWEGLGVFLGLPFLGVLIGWPLRRWIMRTCGRTRAENEPTYARRLLAALADGLANALIPTAIIAFVGVGLYAYNLLTGLFAVLVYATAFGVGGFLTTAGLARASLSPRQVAWRILPVDQEHVWGLLYVIRCLAAVMAVGGVLLVTAYASNRLTPELESIFFLVLTSMLAVLLAWMLRPDYWVASIADSQEPGEAGDAAQAGLPLDMEENGTQEKEPGRHWLDTVRGILRFLVVLAPFVALAGYSRLAYFVQSRIVATIALIGLALLLRLAVHEVIDRLSVRRPNGTRNLSERQDQSGTAASHKLTVFWIGLVADALIFLPLVYVLLLIYGVPATTLELWTRQIISGIEIGGVTISLLDIVLAALVFAAALFVTNIFRRWLANKVLPNTKLDYGARNSIASATGYLGVGIAILLTISALGVDFSNLALVAGALSVGIGFGLRAVVENFVAGLLLLIERPIKVGDWIVVGGNEGIVKHISVRSTEIETFDRSSVIVPNSDLITTAVTNWTHKDRVARVIIPVRAAFGSDPNTVARLLLRCAEENSDVVRFPAPLALFRSFGDSGLNFELRCFLRETDMFLIAQSDLHFAIEDTFRREGITISLPQQDIHIRSGLERWKSGDTRSAQADRPRTSEREDAGETPRPEGSARQRSELGEGGRGGVDGPDGGGGGDGGGSR